MKRMLIAVFAAFVGFGLVAHDAEAKRVGGGKSFGMQRDSQVMKRDAAPQAPTAPGQNAAAPAAGAAAAPGAAAAAQPARSSWLGPLAGLAIGAGLASLFAGTPFGGFLGALALGVLIFFGVMLLLRFFRRPQTERPLQYAGAGGQVPSIGSAIPAPANLSDAANRKPNIPADFDVEGFLRQAKLNFIRLQAANDSGNLDDLRSFTAPEVFAELQMQIKERGQAPQTTDVVTLNAEVLDVSEQDRQYVVSVRFFGSVREHEAGQPEPFDEVWHLSKPTDGSRGWLVAGIQQFGLDS